MRLLQKFDFRTSPYERPNQKWVCGRLDGGKPCHLGPDRRGQCQATHECAPSKTDARWYCNRPPTRGGPCAAGPQPDGTCSNPIPPCTPKLGLRAKRLRATSWVLTIGVGFLALIIAYPGDSTFLKPGPMTTAHSALGNCGSCHANVSDGTLGWMHAIFASTKPELDSQACQKCHEMGPADLSPHGLAPTELEVITRRLRAVAEDSMTPLSVRVRNTVFPASKTVANGVFCATCHNEHQGEKFDPTAMSDDRCQTCHTVQFDSFQNGHPNFGDYPFQRRTRIIFDHSRHFDKHFKEPSHAASSIPDTCADCHKLGQDKRLMIVKPFDQMCASCHLKQIRDVPSNPDLQIAFLTLPELDLVSLSERNAAIGEWPVPEEFEGEITPLMRFLMSGSEERRQVLDAVDEIGDLLDLSEASDEDIAAVEKFVWEVKELVHALVTVDVSDLRSRIAATAGAPSAPRLLEQLTAGMPKNVVVAAAREWLPNLTDELARHRRGERVELPDDLEALEEPEDMSGPDGWHREGFSIFYRTSHHADEFLRTWLEFTAANFKTSEANPSANVFAALTREKAQGQCMRCHSVDAGSGESLEVNWMPFAPATALGTGPASATVGRFTLFSHEQHFGLSVAKGCLTCHELDNKAAYLKTYEAFDPNVFTSNFRPIERKACMTCHTKQKAGEDCQLCHVYHVNDVTTPIMVTKIPGATAELPKTAKPRGLAPSSPDPTFRRTPESSSEVLVDPKAGTRSPQ